MYVDFAMWPKTCKTKYAEVKVRPQIDEAKRKRAAHKDPSAEPGPSRTRQCHRFDKTNMSLPTRHW